MNLVRIKNESWLYTLAFLIALSLRTIQLGAFPLTDAEAAPALQALKIVMGSRPELGPQPAYIHLTALFFFIFGSSNFMARLVPALAGSALVFVPYLFREQIKPVPAVLLAFIFAIEPGLLALSRQAASSILAISLLLFTWGFWNQRRFGPAGVFAALAALSGPALWAGLLGIGITWAIREGIESRKDKDTEAGESDLDQASKTDIAPGNSKSSERGSWFVDPDTRSAFLLPFFLTFISAGSLFFFSPNGLSAALASIPEYFLSWGRSSGVLPGRVLASLLVYQPLALVFTVLAIWRGWRQGSRLAISLSLWMLIAMLLVVFLPARQTGDLGWVLIPLWTLAAMEMTQYLDILHEERREIAGLVLLIFLILVFAWFDLAGLNWTPIPTTLASLRIWLFFGSLFLIVLSILLVAVGWSSNTAKLGGIWGVSLTLGIYTIAGAVGAAGLRGMNSPELWWLGGQPSQVNLLTETADDLSEWSTGDDHALPVVIVQLDSPALEWALRKHPVSVADTVDTTSSPPLVITGLEGNPSLADSYRGQDFAWHQTPAWDSAQFSDWLRWITLRQMPTGGDSLILWARNDLFLDAKATP
jgi:hypothetical protein